MWWAGRNPWIEPKLPILRTAEEASALRTEMTSVAVEPSKVHYLIRQLQKIDWRKQRPVSEDRDSAIEKRRRWERLNSSRNNFTNPCKSHHTLENRFLYTKKRR